MKTKTFLFLIALIPAIVNAQWSKLTIPSLEKTENLNPTVVGLLDTTIFVNANGIYRSTDFGKTWIGSTSSLIQNDGGLSFKIFNGVIVTRGYDGTKEDYFISTDLGETWNPLNNQEIWSNSYNVVQTITSSRYNLIFISNNAEHVFISSDNGTTWNKTKTNLSSSIQKAVSVGSNIFAIGYNSSTYTYSVFLSTNNGITWTSINNGLPIIVSQSEFLVVGTKIFLRSNTSLYSTADNGKTWIPSYKDNRNGSIQYLCSDGKTVYISVLWQDHYPTNEYGAFKSSDFGKTWITTEPNWGSANLMNEKIYLRNSETNAIKYSTDKGYSWILQETQFYKRTKYSISDFTLNGDNLFLGTFTKYTSNSKSINWTPFSVNQYNVASLLTAGTHKFKFGWDSYATYDNGFTWVNIHVPYTSSFGVHGSNGPTVYDFDEFLSQLILAQSNGIFNYLSREQLHNVPAQSITSSDQYMFISAQDGIYHSNDCCKTIERVLPLDYYIKLVANKSTVIGCYLPNGAIWVSFDNGNTWKQEFLGITNIVSIAVDDKYLFFATKDELWKAPLENLRTDVEQQNMPTSFSLSQNYPNPFNPETTINYQLPTSGLVTLKVYDLLGREVATLVDEFKNAGTYNSKFSIINYKLSSGVYFYRLQAGGFSETKKFVLMK